MCPTGIRIFNEDCILPVTPIQLLRPVGLEFRATKRILVSICAHHRVEECTKNGGQKVKILG